jgi:hypothetical protein
MQRRTLLLALAAAGPAAALARIRPSAAAPAEAAVLLRRWPGTPPALTALLSLAHEVPPAALAAWLAAPAGRAAWDAAAGPLAGRLHPVWTGSAPAADPAWFGPEVAARLGPGAPACRAEAPCAPAPLTDTALQQHLAAGPAAAALADRLARHPDPAVRAAVAAARALCAEAQAPLTPAGLAWL